MPRIIVQAEPSDTRKPLNTLTERVQPSDLESDHFAAQLIERVGWAVEDARVVEGARAAERR